MLKPNRLVRDQEPDQPVWSALHAIAAIALVLRLAVAWGSERISHPDELFQYLEQAHRLVYGYGIIPWEYRYGIRNWLLPGALAALLEALRAIGLDRPGVYIPIIKSIAATLSVCIVYASYTIGRRMLSEHCGRIAAVLAAIWYELLYYSTVSTPEVLSAYAIVCALALVTMSGSPRRATLVGLLLGAGVVLRLQYAVPATGLWVLAGLAWNWRLALWVAASGATVFVSAGLLDAWSWGAPFASYYNSVIFNMLHGVSDLFGRKPLLWYFYALGLYSMGLFVLAIGCGVLTWRRCWPILVLVACVVLPHTLLPHKEYRFVFLATPLLLVLLANAAVTGLPRLGLPLSRPAASWIAIAAVAAASVVGSALNGVYRSDDRLVATLDLSRRSDVVAVLDLTGEWWESGGFYYLHRDVPYYFRFHVRDLPVGDLRSLASHALVPAMAAEIPGFRVAARYRSVSVLEQPSPPTAYRQLQTDSRRPFQPGVDDRFAPTVTPRF